MITHIVMICVFLGVFSAMGLGPWLSLFAAFIASAIIGNVVLALLFRK